jgi:uncharacterized protein (TIGR00369 family)
MSAGTRKGFAVHIPFVEMVGLEFVSCDAGEAELAITLRDELCNSWSVAHGGVTMTLLDVVMAHAARSPNQPGHPTSGSVVTIEMKTSFMRPGLGRLVGKGRLLQRTASMAFCEGSVFDEAGQLVAHGTGTFKYIRGLPAGGRRIQRPDASD